MSGQEIDLLELKQSDIEIEDIYTALPNLCRFSGRCKYHYSPAQHSVELYDWLKRSGQSDLARIAILHDACEAYLGDMIMPLKIMFPEFQALEEFVTMLIFDKFGVDTTRYEDFDVYDKNIVVNEMKMQGIYEKNAFKPTMINLKPLRYLDIVPKPISEVRKLFIERLYIEGFMPKGIEL